MIFPKWTNNLPPLLLGGALVGLGTVIGLVWYYFTPKYWRAGYMPAQPALSAAYEQSLFDDARANSKAAQIPGVDYPGFSHQIHAGKLGLDCRYCHSHIEESPEANIPTVSTCIGCHAEGHVNEQLYAKTERVKFIRDAWTNDEPINWRRVHKVPDYVRNFPHNVHLNAGVSCFSCHGNIMEQPVVHQVEALSMGWCLECHRNPEPHLVPKDRVTDLYWVRDQFEATGYQNTANKGKDNVGSPGGAALLQQLQENDLHLLPANCGACHY